MGGGGGEVVVAVGTLSDTGPGRMGSQEGVFFFKFSYDIEYLALAL
jgi:hypothetical protein